MKTYTLFLMGIYFATALPVTAASRLEHALEQRMSAPKAAEPSVRPVASQSSALQGREGQIRLALQKVLEENQVSRAEKISFNTLLTRSQQTDVQNQRLADLTEQAEDVMYQTFYFKGQPEMLFQGRPNYKKLLQGQKYIFISEDSKHETHSCLKETVTILQAARRANPQARILLASEFSLVGDTHVWPIRFSGQPNSNVDTLGDYKQLEQVADRLNLDLLALDDACQAQWQGQFYAKMGGTWIAHDPQNADIIQIAADFGFDDPAAPDYELMQRVAMQTFIAATSYGVQLRNRHWAHYIQAVAPFYDIIVVYGGNAHLSADGMWDSVAFLLNPTQAVSIHLYTDETLAPDLQASYQQSDTLQQKYKAPIPQEEETPLETFAGDNNETEDLTAHVNWKLDFSKTMYRAYNGAEIRSWRAQHVRNPQAFAHLEELEALFDNQLGRGPLHFRNWLDLKIYLK